jgi:hypothetical protein
MAPNTGPQGQEHHYGKRGMRKKAHTSVLTARSFIASLRSGGVALLMLQTPE